MKNILLGMLALAAVAAPGAAFAEKGEMLRRPDFGMVREVVGDAVPLVSFRDNCPAAMHPIADGPCFDTVKASAQPLRVLALIAHYREGERVTGEYGRDFQLYDVRQGEKGIEARVVPLPTSEVRVPRDCYVLNGETVGYVLDYAGGNAVAQESQYVICGGGPDRPNGPYRPVGPVVRSDSNGWGRSEIRLAEGAHRYLAVLGTCDKAYVIRDDHCAKPAVLYMDSHPDVKELDLVAAMVPVQAGDILVDKDIKQWVMKRQSKGYKADGRWFSKSMFSNGNGCWSSEPVRWYIGEVADGLDIAEKAMSRCGAPMAPTPTALFVVYGDDYPIFNCSGDGCSAQVLAYMKSGKIKSLSFVAMGDANRRGRISNGYQVMTADLKDDNTVKLRSGSISVYEGGCTESAGPDSAGVEVWRNQARAYRLMECAVY
jgi:hypothetical protein